MPNNSIKWVLIANGNKANIYNIKNGNYNKLELLKSFTIDGDKTPSDLEGSNLDVHNQTDKHAIEPRNDINKKEKHNFIVNVVHYIDHASATNEFTQLIIAASPEALGELNNTLSKHSLSLIHEKINKDLTHLTIKELSEYLEKHSVK